MGRNIKHFFKRLLALTLAVSCMSFNNIVAFANTKAVNVTMATNGARVIENNGVRMSTTSDGAYEYTTVYDTVHNSIQMSTKNLTTNEVSTGPMLSINIEQETQTRATIHQDTLLNFEYDIWTGSPNEWNLERPEGAFSQYYFKTYENSSNKNELGVWRDAVDTLNVQEVEVIAKSGFAIASACAAAFVSGMASISGGALTPVAIASVVGAVGVTGDAAVAITEMGNCCNDCLYAYMDVFNNTDNTHF